MEVVRHIRRKDLDELAQHVRMHDGLLPSAMTSAGKLINPTYCSPVCHYRLIFDYAGWLHCGRHL